MSTNRVLIYLGGDAESSAYARAKRQQDRIKAELERLETIATGPDEKAPFEFLCPSIKELMAGEGDIDWFYNTEKESTSVSLDEYDVEFVRERVIDELRRFAIRLFDASDRLEGGC